MSAVVVGSTISIATTAAPAVADTSPPVANDPTNPETASAKPLPTAQIGDGVVWSQTIIGNTVYVGGDFSTARPPGAAPGVNTVPRANLLAYDIRTGQLIDSWAPTANAQVSVVTRSPDGSRVYIGGSFTSVNGVNHYRMAALDPSTGALIKGFNPVLNAKVRAIYATSSTVYVGGTFGLANSTVTRSRLAAYSTSGTLLPWAPVAAGGTVAAITMTPDGSKVVVGGEFTTLNGSSNPGYGLGALDPTSGANMPWPANSLIRNGGANSGITSLTTDNDSVYATGYKFGSGGVLEGTTRMNNDGTINWVEDCHGDTYGAYPSGGVIYKVSHAHFCGNVPGGFNQPAVWKPYHGLAYSKVATGVARKDYVGYTNWQGVKDPSILQWFPQLDVGTFTGQTQAAWDITGNDDYIIAGGEFPEADGMGQQGLVRYAKRSAQPDTDAPELSGPNFVPKVTSPGAGEALVSWQNTYDRENRNLKYSVIRDNNNASPVYTSTQGSNPWDEPFQSFLDTGVTPGSHTYKIWVQDPLGNTSKGNNVTVNVAGTGAATDAYTKAVLSDGPESLWRLDEPSGSTTLNDYTGYDPMTVNSSVATGAAGAISGHNAATLSGSGSAAGALAKDGAWWYSVEAWVKTTSTAGGRIVGFSSAKSGTSASNQYDRQLYMSTSGKLNFGTQQGGKNTLTSASSYNNGTWHHVVGTVGDSGMNLYVDGSRVGQRTDIHTAGSYVGYWRIGGDTLSGWANAPAAATNALAGQVDEVAVYQRPLTGDQVRAHYVASGRTMSGTPTPTDTYGKAVYDDGPDLYWRLGETSGTVAADSSQNGNPGTYVNSPTLGGSSAVGVATDKSMGTDGVNDNVAQNTSTPSSAAYSEELWFKTATAGQTSGGELMGFGNAKTGSSTSYDRTVYMTNAGKLRFGVFPSSTDTAIESPNSYNDGAWHHMVATQGTRGMQLYVDGQQVATGPEVDALNMTGYWRVGGDNLASRASRPSSDYFKGSLDEAAVYPRALSLGEVQSHFSKGGGAVANSLPTAAFTSTATGKKVSFDGTSSSDPDGSIASYAWDFGGGNTSTASKPTFTFATSGDKTVSLTVTDDKGGTNTLTKVVHVDNSLPVADFTSTVNGKQVTFNGTPSSDVDGTIASYAWNFGDGSTDTTSGANVSHTYDSAGSKTVTLTVTDDEGGTSPVTTKTVVAGNAAPTANFTSTTNNLHADFTSTSNDTDGTITSYAWDFGDGNTDTTSGATVGHDYAIAGTYQVKLTVTDNDSGTANVTKSISVNSAGTPTTLASDDFERTVTGGWGSAVLGGPWSMTSSPSSDYGVNSGSGVMNDQPSGSRGMALGALSSADTDTTVKLSLSKLPEGNSFSSINARVAGKAGYRAKVKVVASGALSLTLASLDSAGAETTLKAVNVPSVTVTPGAQIQVRFQVQGSNPTNLRAKAWLAGTAEPGSWQVTWADSNAAALQGVAGGLSLTQNVASTVTAPFSVRWDDLVVTTVP